MVGRKKRFQFIGAFHVALARLSLLLKQATLRLCPSSVILYLQIYITFFLQAHNSTLVYTRRSTSHKHVFANRNAQPEIAPVMVHLPECDYLYWAEPFMRKRLCRWPRRLRHSVRNRPPNAPNLRYANLLHALQPHSTPSLKLSQLHTGIPGGPFPSYLPA